MLGIQFIKFSPTTYVIHYKKGKIKHEGKGLAFYYYAPSSSIAAIPAGTDDAAFIFNEITNDYQSVSVQGVITYKIDNPKQLAEMLDFTVNSDGTYKTDDYQKVSNRLINEAHTSTTDFVRALELKMALNKIKDIEKTIMAGLQASEALKSIGIIPLSINVQAIKPTAEMARALETSTRESLQKDADKAIYDRRNFAVEQEKKIKESEMDTEIAVEEKKKQISEKKLQTELMVQENKQLLRDKQLTADIDFETKNQSLLTQRAQNTRTDADAKAYVLEKTLKPYKDFDWKTLSLILHRNTSPADNISVAFRELAENANKISNLNISPELLNSLMHNQEIK
jgi:regulator of protease activity HflC (stomatin/prohibitin superfamily)